MSDSTSHDINGNHTTPSVTDDSHVDLSYSSLKRSLTIGSTMKLGQPIVADNCVPKFIEMVSQYTKITLQLSKFNSKSSGIQKTNYLRISLLSFLRTNNDRLYVDSKVMSRYSKSFKVVYKGMKILLKWWEIILGLLVDNKKPIPNSQKSVYYECISRLLTRFEWNYIDINNSTISNNKKYNFAELNISHTTLLVKTLNYCINQISTKSNTLLPIQAFIGKVFAVCFFSLDGVSNALLFLLNIRVNSVIVNYESFFKNELKNKNASMEHLFHLFPDTVKYLMSFDRLTYGMNLGKNHHSASLGDDNTNSASDTNIPCALPRNRKPNFNAIQPPNAPVRGISDPQGFWVKKWCNYNSDIFNSFLRHYLQKLNLIIDSANTEICFNDLYYLPGLNIIFSHVYDIIVWTIKTSIANNTNMDSNVGNLNNGNSSKKFGSSLGLRSNGYGIWGSKFNIQSTNNPFSSNINNNITLGFYDLESNKYNNSLLPISKIFYTIRDFLYNNCDLLNCPSIDKMNLNDLKFKRLIITKFDNLLIKYAKNIYAHDFFRAGYVLDLFQEFLIQSCSFNIDVLQDQNNPDLDNSTSKNGNIFDNSEMSHATIMSFVNSYYASGIDWDFWLTAVQNMLLTLNINCQLKALSFLFNIWVMIPDINADEDDADEESGNTYPTLKKISPENKWYKNKKQSIRYNFAIWLTSTKNWINFFCNWQSLVRSYYLRFVVWRLLGIKCTDDNLGKADHSKSSDEDDEDDENYGLFFDVSRSVIKERPKFNMSHHQDKNSKSSYVNHEKLKKIISDRLNLSYEKIIKISEYSSIGHYMMPDMNGTTAIANKKFIITPLKPVVVTRDPLQSQLDSLNLGDKQDVTKNNSSKSKDDDETHNEKNISANRVSTIKRKRFSFVDFKNSKKLLAEDIYDDDDVLFDDHSNNKNDESLDNNKADGNALDPMDDVLLHGLVPSLNMQIGNGSATTGQVRKVSPFEIFDDAVYSSSATSLMDNNHSANKTNNGINADDNDTKHGSNSTKGLERKFTIQSKTNSSPALFSIKRSQTKKNKENTQKNVSTNNDVKSNIKSQVGSTDQHLTHNGELKHRMHHTKSIAGKTKSFSNLSNHGNNSTPLSKFKNKSGNNISALHNNETTMNGNAQSENSGKILGFAIKLFKRSKSSGNLNGSSHSYNSEPIQKNLNGNSLPESSISDCIKKNDVLKNPLVTPPLPNLKNMDLLTPQDIETIRNLNSSEHSFTDSVKTNSTTKKSNRTNMTSLLSNINQGNGTGNNHLTHNFGDNAELDLDNDSFSISFDDYSSIDSSSERSLSGKLLRKKTSMKSLKNLTNNSLKVMRKKSGTLSSTSLKSMTPSTHSNSSIHGGNSNGLVLPGSVNSYTSTATPKKSSLDSLILPPEFKIKVPDVERQIFKFSLVSTEIGTNYQLSIINNSSFTKFYNPMSYYNFKKDNKFPQYPLLPFGEQSGGMYYATDEEHTRYTDLSFEDVGANKDFNNNKGRQQYEEDGDYGDNDTDNDDDEFDKVESFENLLISEKRISQGTFYSCNMDFYHDPNPTNGIRMIEEGSTKHAYYNDQYQAKIFNSTSKFNGKELKFSRERARAQRILKKWNVVGKSLNEWNDVVNEYEMFFRSDGSEYISSEINNKRASVFFNAKQTNNSKCKTTLLVPLLIAEAPAQKVNAS